MIRKQTTPDAAGNDRFLVSRRTFVKALSAGLLISVTPVVAQERRRPSRRSTIAARLHIGEDGTITVMTGKVEVGQGSRAEITQAAAEELRVPVDAIQLIMADTSLCPDDGVTAGSRTTPSTIPAVRRGCAAAREVLREVAAKRWGVARDSVSLAGGAATHSSTNRKLSYAELATGKELADALQAAVRDGVVLTAVSEWKVLGTSVPRPNVRDLVTGAHEFPSDVVRPNMLRGKVLRPPSYGARLVSLDVTGAEAIEGVRVVRDGEFVGCAAPTTALAAAGLEALQKGAAWEPAPHPSSRGIFEYLKARARTGRRGGGDRERAVREALDSAHKTVQGSYRTAYIQHAPMETRAATAEWDEGKLTVWTGSQAPFRVRSELARELGVPSDAVRVIIPDTGGGFGGKHSGEYAVEAARLARGVGRPVALKWTREEEFTWAYYRPAALIEIEAGLDEDGSIAAWNFINFNSGGSAIESPYEIPTARAEYRPSDAPMRHGSYRTLAATANNFARECFMDELAAALGKDPLAFRLAQGMPERLRNVLEAAVKRFDWNGRKERKKAGVGIGLACGTEKGSYVAACVEASADRQTGAITVRHVCEVFECGAVLNPSNLRSQVEGCIVMGLGGALMEEVAFEDGKVLTDRFSRYRVPRFRDVPPLEIELLDRKDLDSVGGGETPIIAIAPAIGNAVFDAIGVRLRSMPLRLPPPGED